MKTNIIKENKQFSSKRMTLDIANVALTTKFANIIKSYDTVNIKTAQIKKERKNLLEAYDLSKDSNTELDYAFGILNCDKKLAIITDYRKGVDAQLKSLVNISFENVLYVLIHDNNIQSFVKKVTDIFTVNGITASVNLMNEIAFTAYSGKVDKSCKYGSFINADKKPANVIRYSILQCYKERLTEDTIKEAKAEKLSFKNIDFAAAEIEDFNKVLLSGKDARYDKLVEREKKKSNKKKQMITKEEI